MVEKLSPTAKVSISAFSVLVIMSSIFITAVYMRDIFAPFLPTRSTTGGVVAGVTTDTVPNGDESSYPTAGAEVTIEDNGAGSATMSLTLDSFARVAGLDLSFAVSGDVELIDVTCADEYECVSTVIDEDSLRIIVYRPPNVAGELWSGTSAFATITYTSGTYGTLEMNDGIIRPSEVLEVGTGVNILPEVARSFTLGQ